MKTTVKLEVRNSGDWDVGLQGFNVDVQIACDDESLIDNEFQSALKKFLKDWYSEYDGKTSVYTENDLADMIAYEESLIEGK